MSLKVFLLLILSTSALALDNGLARTPPMGWMAWERFRCITDCDEFPHECISENLFMDMADRLAKDGWSELGYKYVSIDDCWMAKERDSSGKLYGDKSRFPHGIKALADYIHERHLKFGIYEDFGTKTCGGYPGSEGYEATDAKTFAEWGVDMLKFDGCYSNDSSKAVGYPLMGEALNSTKRPILYSCSWPAYDGGLPPKVNYTELGLICNSWRNYGDIQDSWADVLDIIEWYAKNEDVLAAAAGPGHWNDPDMLIVGDFSLSFEQSKAQFGMWAMLAAPLFMSNDLRTISHEAREILQNRWVIGINQDGLGKQGKRFVNKDSVQGWGRQLMDERFAVAVLSARTDDIPYRFTFTLAQASAVYGLRWRADAVFSLHEVFENRDYGMFTASEPISVLVESSSIKMFHVMPVDYNLMGKFDGRL